MKKQHKFYTEEERKNKINIIRNGFYFQTCYDLSEGITVYSNNKFNQEQYSQALSIFFGFWFREHFPKLNGFPGLDTVKYKFKNF